VKKLLVLSDLHLDLAGHDPPDATGVDVVVASGDISPGTSGLNWLLDKFPSYLPIIYVPGNHEYYKHNYPALIEKLRAQGKGTNVRVLNNEAVKVCGITFLGATLWTDFRLKGPGQAFWAMDAAQRQMNDYRQIRLSNQSYRRLQPQDTQRFHLESYKWLCESLPPKSHNGPVVVVSHHAPSSLSVRWFNDKRGDLTDLDASYASNLENLMLRGHINLWVHGHTHRAQDYHIGETRVLCNPRGYPDEDSGWDPEIMVEVQQFRKTAWAG
jgi:predicted phosphodiesterase